MLSRCGFFVTWLVSITAASLRFPSEFATVMVIDAKRNANFRGRLKKRPVAECRCRHLPRLHRLAKRRITLNRTLVGVLDFIVGVVLFIVRAVLFNIRQDR